MLDKEDKEEDESLESKEDRNGHEMEEGKDCVESTLTMRKALHPGPNLVLCHWSRGSTIMVFDLSLLVLDDKNKGNNNDHYPIGKDEECRIWCLLFQKLHPTNVKTIIDQERNVGGGKAC